MTTYEYDEQGRVSRAVTTTEPEWDTDQQAWVLALAEYERDLCPGCRMPLHITTKKVLRPDGKLDLASYEQWKVAADDRCFVCAAVNDAKPTLQTYKDPESLRLTISRR